MPFLSLHSKGIKSPAAQDGWRLQTQPAEPSAPRHLHKVFLFFYCVSWRELTKQNPRRLPNAEKWLKIEHNNYHREQPRTQVSGGSCYCSSQTPPRRKTQVSRGMDPHAQRRPETSGPRELANLDRGGWAMLYFQRTSGGEFLTCLVSERQQSYLPTPDFPSAFIYSFCACVRAFTHACMCVIKYT